MDIVEMTCRFGCGQRFKLNCRQTHENVCPATLEWCSNGCGELYRRDEMKAHQNGDCPERSVKCKCLATMKQKDMEVFH